MAATPGANSVALPPCNLSQAPVPRVNSVGTCFSGCGIYAMSEDARAKHVTRSQFVTRSDRCDLGIPNVNVLLNTGPEGKSVDFVSSLATFTLYYYSLQTYNTTPRPISSCRVRSLGLFLGSSSLGSSGVRSVGL
jgi:hypothetical protein